MAANFFGALQVAVQNLGGNNAAVVNAPTETSASNSTPASAGEKNLGLLVFLASPVTQPPVPQQLPAAEAQIIEGTFQPTTRPLDTAPLEALPANPPELPGDHAATAGTPGPSLSDTNLQAFLPKPAPQIPRKDYTPESPIPAPGPSPIPQSKTAAAVPVVVEAVPSNLTADAPPAPGSPVLLAGERAHPVLPERSAKTRSSAKLTDKIPDANSPATANSLAPANAIQVAVPAPALGHQANPLPAQLVAASESGSQAAPPVSDRLPATAARTPSLKQPASNLPIRGQQVGLSPSAAGLGNKGRAHPPVQIDQAPAEIRDNTTTRKQPHDEPAIAPDKKPADPAPLLVEAGSSGALSSGAARSDPASVSPVVSLAGVALPVVVKTPAAKTRDSQAPSAGGEAQAATKPLPRDNHISLPAQLRADPAHAWEQPVAESAPPHSMHTEPKPARSDAKPDAGHAPTPPPGATGASLSAPPPPPVPTDTVNNVPLSATAPTPVANPQTPHLAAPSSVTTKPEVASPDDAPLAPPPSREIVQSVRIVDRLGQAEIHLGVRTESFGSVQVHTVVRNSQVGLTVGSERGDIKAFFAGEVPGLESNLRQHELNFADIRFLGGPASGLNAQTGGNAHSQSFQQGRSLVPAVPQPAHAAESEPEEYRPDSRAGLSVHA